MVYLSTHYITEVHAWLPLRGPVDFPILATKKRVTKGQRCVTLNREEEKKWGGEGGARLVLMILNINCFIKFICTH